jgi:hypothetical protein
MKRLYSLRKNHDFEVAQRFNAAIKDLPILSGL